MCIKIFLLINDFQEHTEVSFSEMQYAFMMVTQIGVLFTSNLSLDSTRIVKNNHFN